jgi:eukaryotic-like serine/threonine-protein kinase
VEKPIWLRIRDGEAAAEFQKILDHRGIVLNSAIGVLAHLELAQPCVQQRETSKARTAYQDFLTLWKDADPDIPILIAAKAEYARLHQIRYSPAGLGSPRAASDES